MSDTTNETLEGGNYEVVRARLLAQAKDLGARLDRMVPEVIERNRSTGG